MVGSTNRGDREHFGEDFLSRMMLGDETLSVMVLASIR